ncbi:MAG: hypothetical protein ACI8W8_002241 [Rhodothermales bacterium]|jgi:hypothetical protein
MNRREILRDSALGFGSLALSGLCANDGLRSPHFRPRAKRVIFLFMHGGPSHVDTFDYKPKLIADDGKPLPFAKPRVQFAETGNLGRPRWDFKAHGQSGAMVSSLFPELAKHVDELCFVKSLHGTNEAHGGALLKLHTGSDSLVRPSMGSWISYGLGNENNDLPSFVTIAPTLGHGGSANWSSAFLPAANSGVPVATSGSVKDAKIAFLGQSDARQRQILDFTQRMNRQHARGHTELESRIKSAELAFRMQSAAPLAFDVESESKATKALYGVGDSTTDEFGRRCLLARRLAERGVRFVQLSHPYWDQHGGLRKKHADLAAGCDRPIAGLLTDLKARGMLDDTLVLWGGEFGRTPTMQGKDGRDHNPHAFTIWMAGGGVRPGFSYGATDDYGFYAVENKVHVHDLHATILALMGLDHEALTFRHAGRDFRLTDVSGRIVHELFA